MRIFRQDSIPFTRSIGQFHPVESPVAQRPLGHKLMDTLAADSMNSRLIHDQTFTGYGKTSAKMDASFLLFPKKPPMTVVSGSILPTNWRSTAMGRRLGRA
jgi:hypothetical protein